MFEKTFKNVSLGVEITSYIDKQQNIWFRGRDVAEILGYSNTKKAVLTHVDIEDKKQLFTYHTSAHKTWTVASNANGPKMGPVGSNANGPKMGPVGSNANGPKTWTAAPSGSMCTYINESGFYSLVLSSKLETAKKFKRWVTKEVLPSIRKYG